MQKIDKLIRLSLYNPNANEAASALKRAAAVMQEGGINPADFLQEKGANSSHGRSAAEYRALQNDYLALQNGHRVLQSDCQALQRKIKELEARLANNRSGTADASELREAKEQAIKWYRISQTLNESLKGLAPATVLAQAKIEHLQTQLGKFKKRFIPLGILVLIAISAVSYQVAYSAGENNRAALSELGTDGGEHKSAVVPAVAKSRITERPVVFTLNKATCFIQQKIPYQGQSQLHSVRFWFTDGIVTPVVDGKVSTNDASKDKTSMKAFLDDINKRWPGASACKLGVNE